MAGEDCRSTRLGSSFRRLIGTALALVSNRFALLATELSLEKWRVLEICFLGAVCWSAAFIAIILLTVLVIMTAPSGSRLEVLAALTSIYGLSAVWAALRIRQRVKNWPPFFADSIDQLKKDRECWLNRKS